MDTRGVCSCIKSTFVRPLVRTPFRRLRQDLRVRSAQAPYGFYILNRMGTDDYVRSIYPEDDMEIMGDYLMYRSYPDFTKTRVDMGLPYPIPEEHRDAFYCELSKRIPPEGQTKGKEKEKEKRGRSITLGLWMFATDAREPLKEVMMRYVHIVSMFGLSCGLGTRSALHRMMWKLDGHDSLHGAELVSVKPHIYGSASILQ